jgi:hypothetical protein
MGLAPVKEGGIRRLGEAFFVKPVELFVHPIPLLKPEPCLNQSTFW